MLQDIILNYPTVVITDGGICLIPSVLHILHHEYKPLYEAHLSLSLLYRQRKLHLIEDQKLSHIHQLQRSKPFDSTMPLLGFSSTNII